MKKTKLIVPLLFFLFLAGIAAGDEIREKNFRKGVHNYDKDGFAQDKNGQLFWLDDAVLGRYTYLKDSDKLSLLYYQYSNQQRDGIILARWDGVMDNLPDGRALAIKRGYGAVKLNSVLLSGLKGVKRPHFGNNVKEYRHFTIQDWLLGFGFGVLGPEAELRFVSADTWVFYAHASLNILTSLELTPLYGSFGFKTGFGVGARIPAPIQLPLIGKHYWGLYLDMAVGLGGENSFIPGLFFEFTKCTFDDPNVKRKGGLPYNYHVNEYYLRFGVHLDTRENGSGTSFDLSLGYRFAIRGSKIPGHEQKTTQTVYIHPEYRIQKDKENR